MAGVPTAGLVASLVLIVAISGLTAGAEADSRAEIERSLGDPPELDWDQQEDPRLRYVPEKYSDPLDVDVFPDSTLLESQYKPTVEWLYHFLFDVAERAALFGYAHPEIFGNRFVQAGLQFTVLLPPLYAVAVPLNRVRKMWRGESLSR